MPEIRTRFWATVCAGCGQPVPGSSYHRCGGWQACPVCGGCGTVPPDFYTRLGVGTSCARERCRTCNGSGVVGEQGTTQPYSESERRALRGTYGQH